MQQVIGMIVTVVLSMIGPTLAQDGQLVEASAVTWREGPLTRLEAVEPTIRTILAQVDLKAMTYLSDGKVTMRVTTSFALARNSLGSP
jgi:hypothetical protein